MGYNIFTYFFCGGVGGCLDQVFNFETETCNSNGSVTVQVVMSQFDIFSGLPTNMMGCPPATLGNGLIDSWRMDMGAITAPNSLEPFPQCSGFDMNSSALIFLDTGGTPFASFGVITSVSLCLPGARHRISQVRHDEIVSPGRGELWILQVHSRNPMAVVLQPRNEMGSDKTTSTTD